MTEMRDPYKLDPAAIEEPPKTFWKMFRRIGPGLVLAGAIVGSGELVAATVMGAENGYSLLWLILVSCAIKIVVQNEIGRYAIGTGETALEAFDRVPGPRWRVSWVVWMWFFMVMAIMFTIGGMLGGISEVAHILVPSVGINSWVWVIVAVTAGILIMGRYELIERVSLAMVVSFTILTVSCAFLLFDKPEYFSWNLLWEGLQFKRPEGGFVTAVAVFGMTGVGAGELFFYPYWCLEKGYARFTGPEDGTPGWRRRARGWIKVMGLDVLNAMVIYTFATVAFYLLGAGVLHGMGVIPRGTEMIMTLSSMYTETLGRGSHYVFLVGAVAVLYSTVFSATAGHGRLLADFLAMVGLYDKRDYEKRFLMTRISIVIMLLLPCIYFLYVQEPVVMVKIGGVAQALMLPALGFSTVYLRYKHLPKAIVPKGWLTLALWVTSAIMAVMMGYSVVAQLFG